MDHTLIGVEWNDAHLSRATANKTHICDNYKCCREILRGRTYFTDPSRRNKLCVRCAIKEGDNKLRMTSRGPKWSAVAR